MHVYKDVFANLNKRTQLYVPSCGEVLPVEEKNQRGPMGEGGKEWEALGISSLKRVGKGSM